MNEMVNHLTVEELYNIHHEKLGLQWIAGQQGKKRNILPEETKDQPPTLNIDLDTTSDTQPIKPDVLSTQSLIGYLNLIHPHQIQVIGEMELEYIDGLRDISRQDAVRQLFKHQPACIIISEDIAVPIFLKRKCNENSIPLFSSPLPSNKLTDTLHYYLANLFADGTGNP